MSDALFIHGPTSAAIDLDDLRRRAKAVAERLAGGKACPTFNLCFETVPDGLFPPEKTVLGFWEDGVLQVGGHLGRSRNPGYGPDRQFLLTVGEFSRDEPAEVFLCAVLAIAVADLSGATYVEDPAWVLCTGGEAVSVADLLAAGDNAAEDFLGGVTAFFARLPLQGRDL